MKDIFSEFNLSGYGFVGMFNLIPIQPKPKDIVFTRTTSSPSTMTMRLKVISGEYVTVNGLRYDGQGNTDIIISTTNDEFRIQYSTQTAITKISLDNTQVTGDISALANLTNLTQIYLYATQATGDISALANLTNLTQIYLCATQVTGDISVLANLTNLTQICLSDTQVTGDISVLANLTNLGIFYLYATQVTGDISALANLTNLGIFYLYATQVTGDISALANLTNLGIFSLSDTQVTGDISVLANLTNLTKIYLNNIQVRGPDTIISIHVSSTISLKYNAMTTVQIDNILQSLVNGNNTNMTVYLDGSNEAPSSTGEQAIDTLRSNGCTVTVTGGY